MLIEKWQAIVAEIGQLIRTTFEELVAAARRVIEAFVPLDEGLLLSRPLPRPRPPTQINPGGGITAVPLGRPAFRPPRTY